MGTLIKKHLELYKINRQIRSLNREMVADTVSPLLIVPIYPNRAQERYSRPSEKHEIIRMKVSSLLDQRDAIRNS